MAIRPFLAMSGAEMGEKTDFSFPAAWLACRFSSWGRGLSDLPPSLPEGSLLILTDQTPIRGHDARTVLGQLEDCLNAFGCRGLLLDFQRPGCPDGEAMAKALVQALPCPVVVSEAYARNLDCGVFLPPVPPSMPLQAHLAPWKGRDIWLELALDGECIRLTERGADVTPLTFGWEGNGFAERSLHCHYRVEQAADAMEFILWRTREDVNGLIGEAEDLGVSGAVGLYQELGA